MSSLPEKAPERICAPPRMAAPAAVPTPGITDTIPAAVLNKLLRENPPPEASC